MPIFVAFLSRAIIEREVINMILNYLWIGLILSFINIIIRVGLFKMEELAQPEGSNGLQYFLGIILGIVAITPIWPGTTILLIMEFTDFLKGNRA